MSWEKFVTDFDKAVDECASTGMEKRLQIGFTDGNYDVVVDVYPKGGTMKKFDDFILAAAKQHVGMSVPPEDE